MFTTDIDGDGRDDLVYQDANSQSWVQISNGTSFRAPVATNMTGLSGLQPWDLDGDGSVDFVGSVPGATLGGMQAFTPQAFRASGETLAHLAAWDPPTGTVLGGMVGDFDGDMLADYLTKPFKLVTPAKLISLGLQNPAAPTWGAARSLGNLVWPDQILDIDGDGLVDLLSGSSATEIGAAGAESRNTSLTRNGCTTFVDVNGDGLPDQATFSPTGISVRINRGGAEFGPAYNALAAGSAYVDLQCASYPGLNGIAAVDYNQDGKQDLLAMGPGGQAVQVYLSNGSTFSLSSLGWSLIPSRAGQNAYLQGKDAHVLDVNGDGVFDLIFLDRYNPSQITLAVQASGYADLLTNIVEPMGEQRQVAYAPLSTTSYHRPAAVYPQRGYDGPLMVVTSESMDVSNVSGSWPGPLTVVANHTYGGALIDARGDGWLGFATHSVTDPRTGAVTVTNYDQTRVHLAGADRYPYKGMPTQVLSYVLTNGPWHATLTRTQYAWAETNGGKSWFSYPSSTDSRDFEMPNGGYGFDPTYALQAFSTTSPNPNVLHVAISTTGAPDAFGNAAQTQLLKGPNETYATATHYRTTTTRTFSNDTTNWLIGLVTSESTLSETPGGNGTRTVATSYDANGRVAQSVREPSDSGSLYLRTTTTRNAYELPTNVSVCGYSGACRTQSIGYDADLIHVTSATNALGFSSTMIWHPGLDAVLSQSDANGLTMTFARDTFGRLQKTTFPDGSWKSVSLAAYAGSNYPLVETVTGSDGSRTVVDHDRLGREAWRNTLTLDGSTSYAETWYDNFGNVSNRYRPSFGAPVYYTGYSYDALNRPISAQLSDVGQAQTVSYLRNVVTTTDESGVVTTTTRDSSGHIIATGTSAGQSRYQYGAFDTLVSVTDANNNIVTMSYDAWGRRLTLADRDIGTVTTAYDAFGDLLTSTDAKGQTTTSSYDVLGRLVQRTAPDGTDTWSWDAPNAKGKLASRARAGESTTWTYDSLGRSTRESWIIDGVTYNYDTTYDTQGRPLATSYPDAPGRPRFTVDRVYNQYGYLTQVRDISVAPSPKPLWTAQTMNAEGHITQELLGNGLTNNRAYFGDTGLIQRETTANIYDMEYSYQPNGDLAWRTDHLNGGPSSMPRTESFTYDAANRLASATVSDRATATYSYSYDALGNLTAAGDSPCSGYAYGEGAAGPHALTSLTCNGIHYSNAYDSNGNETIADRPSLLQTTWTSFNKPLLVQSPDGQMQYTYDADHVRVKKTKISGSGSGPSGVWSTTIFAGGGFEKRIGATTDDVYYVSAGGRMIAQLIWRESTGVSDWRYMHGDRQGTVERTTDAAGALKESISSDAWGARRSSDWTATGPAPIPADTRIGYTGHEYDDEFSLVDMGGRIYDPLFKRFTSADSIVQDVSYGPSLNRYSYTFNNPLRYSDPTGHMSILDPTSGGLLSTSTVMFFSGMTMAALSATISESFVPVALSSDGRVAISDGGYFGMFCSIINGAIQASAPSAFSSISNALGSLGASISGIATSGVRDIGAVLSDPGDFLSLAFGGYQGVLCSESDCIAGNGPGGPKGGYSGGFVTDFARWARQGVLGVIGKILEWKAQMESDLQDGHGEPAEEKKPAEAWEEPPAPSDEAGDRPPERTILELYNEQVARNAKWWSIYEQKRAMESPSVGDPVVWTGSSFAPDIPDWIVVPPLILDPIP